MKVKTLGVLGGIGLACLVGFSGVISHATEDQVTFVVEDKERITAAETSYYLVFTDNGVFKNTDNMWQLKFNSSDLQADLKRGKEYTCKKNFWRVPFLSMYENLIECK